MAYTKSYSYINTIPDLVTFSVPYNDGSGKKFEVIFDAAKPDAYIKQGQDNILIEQKDLEALIQMLKDVKDLVEFKNAPKQ